MGEALTGVNGNIIRWARETYNMKVSEAAVALNVSNEKYLEWEDGKEYPTYAKLKKISNVFRKPSAIFFFPSPPEIPDNKGDLRTLPNVVINKLSKHVVIQFELARVYQINLFELYGNKSSTFNNMSINLEKTTNVAYTIRLLLGYTLKSQKKKKNAKSVFEEFRERLYALGVYVFKNSFRDDSVSGISVADKNYPIIIINNKMSFARQNSTLFHELYHLMLKSNGVEIVNDDYFALLNPSQRSSEKACDEFASEFLVPHDDLISELHGLKIDAPVISHLSQLYSVSKDMILYRLYGLKAISLDTYQMYRELFYGESIRTQPKDKPGGNPYYTKLSYLGNSYAGEVFRQYSEHRIDAYKASELLGVRVEHLPRYEGIVSRGNY